VRREQYEFGPVERMEPDTTGTLDDQKYRLLVQRGRSVACLWLDRERLLDLAALIEHVLGSTLRVVWPSAPWEPPRGFPTPDVELTVGDFALEHDERSDHYPMLAQCIDAHQEVSCTFSCVASHEQLRTLLDRIAGAIAGEHTRCPLCGCTVTEANHSCHGQNGHIASSS